MKFWWESFIPEENTWYRWQLAGAEFFVCRTAGQWRSAVQAAPWAALAGEAAPVEAVPAGQTMVGEGPPPAGLGVEKTVASGPQEGKSAALKPFFSGKPFLIKWGNKLRLLPGAESSLTLGLPPSLKFTLDREILFSFNPFILSDTWYGKDTMNGVICTSLNAELSVPAGVPVCCTVHLRNHSKQSMELDRIILHAEELSMYESGGQLYSDIPVFDFFGGGEFKTGIKTFHGEHKKLVNPGIKNSMGLIRHGTRIIKNITRLS